MPRKLESHRALSARASDDLYARLVEAADRNGRSLAQEMISRLEHSFLIEDTARVVRETVRQEMRAEFEARREVQLRVVSDNLERRSA